MEPRAIVKVQVLPKERGNIEQVSTIEPGNFGFNSGDLLFSAGQHESKGGSKLSVVSRMNIFKYLWCPSFCVEPTKSKPSTACCDNYTC